jgi:phosphomannomutase
MTTKGETMKTEEIKIKFGTDGWRAVIAEQFTFENVRRVARAIACYCVSQKKNPGIVIGYDTRFLSDVFAEIVAEQLRDAGAKVILSDGVISTPALSSGVVSEKAFGGVMISASHNPPEFNGIKFKTAEGGSSPETVTREFEKNLNEADKFRKPGGTLQRKDLKTPYWNRLRSSVDLSIIRKSRTAVIADPMHGAGIGYLSSLLKSTGCRVQEIHGTPDPLFGGLHPEPIEQYLKDLKAAVRSSSVAAGLATDGDADRIGVVDDRGRYLTPHQVFPLLLYYLCEYKGLRGKVVQAISLGYLSERIAREYGLPFEETPVGFKYIAERISNEKILMGGEESGGYGYGSYLPERDGILNSLMIIEMLSATAKPLSALVAEMEKKFGKSAYLRTDFKNPGIPKDEFVTALKTRIPVKIAGLRVRQVKDYDGIEFILEDDSWLLLRPSGTEPIIRVYAESEKVVRTEQIIAWGNRAVNHLTGHK